MAVRACSYTCMQAYLVFQMKPRSNEKANLQRTLRDPEGAVPQLDTNLVRDGGLGQGIALDDFVGLRMVVHPHDILRAVATQP